MYSEEAKSSTLAKLLCGFNKVFVDTCSLMEDSFPQFMEVLDKSREYWKDVTEIIVLGECIDELKKHSKSEDPIKRIGAKQALKILKHDRWHHKVITKTKASHDDSFADRAIYAKVSDLRIAEKILVITQDKKLTNDIRGLNKLESQKGRIINVYLINKDGDLEVNYGEKTFERKPSRNPVRNRISEQTKPEPKKTVQEKPKTIGKSPVVLAESTLLANISNPNYPLAKKLEDIEKQLVALKALSPAEKKQLELRLTEDKLLSEKKRLQGTVAEKPKEQPKEEKKPEQPQPKAFFEYGKTPSQALNKLGKHYGWMFRDPSISFFEGIHGAYDLTTDDLVRVDNELSGLAVGEKKDHTIKKLVLSFEKKATDFAVFMKGVVEEPKQKEEKKQAPEKTKKKKTAEATPKAPKEKAENIVSEPKETKAKKTKKTPQKKVEEPKEKPQPKQPKKPAETKKEVAPKAKKEVKRSAGFEEAVKYDKILNANINNPNYPRKNVEKDIESQMYRVKHLKPGEAKELLLGLKALEAKRVEVHAQNEK